MEGKAPRSIILGLRCQTLVVYVPLWNDLVGGHTETGGVVRKRGSRDCALFKPRFDLKLVHEDAGLSCKPPALHLYFAVWALSLKNALPIALTARGDVGCRQQLRCTVDEVPPGFTNTHLSERAAAHCPRGTHSPASLDRLYIAFPDWEVWKVLATTSVAMITQDQRVRGGRVHQVSFFLPLAKGIDGAH